MIDKVTGTFVTNLKYKTVAWAMWACIGVNELSRYKLNNFFLTMELDIMVQILLGNLHVQASNWDDEACRTLIQVSTTLLYIKHSSQ